MTFCSTENVSNRKSTRLSTRLLPSTSLLALAISSACIGNSSSGIKETPAFKCPFLNIGNRQKGRLRSDNIIEVSYDSQEIFSAIKKSLFDEEFKEQVSNCLNPYGSGNAGKKISDILATVPLTKELIHKKMSY